MSWSQSANIFAGLIEKTTPEYRKEQKWEEDSREMERQKFAELMKTSKANRQKQELENQLNRSKQEALDKYHALREVNTAVAEFVSDKDFQSMPEAERILKLKEYEAKISDPMGKQLFIESVSNGDVGTISRTLDSMESQLETKFGVKFDDVNKKMFMGRDGQIRYLREDSPLIDREAADWEIQAHRENILPGSDEWKARADPDWAKQNDMVEVVNPNDPSLTMYVPKGDMDKYEPPGNKREPEAVSLKDVLDKNGNRIGSLDINNPDPEILERVLSGEYSVQSLATSSSSGSGAGGKTSPEHVFKSALFASRVQKANEKLLEHQNEFSEINQLGQFAPNFMKSENRKVFEQNTKDFINAVLRRESGAVIADSEFANAELQYIPKAGDTEEVLMQKAESRRIVEQALAQQGGAEFLELQRKLAGPDAIQIDMGNGEFAFYEVGTILENGRGQKARVMADGTMEWLADSL